MNEKHHKRSPLNLRLLMLFILSVWSIVGILCFLINLFFPFNLGGRVVVDMVPIPIGAYDIRHSSYLSPDAVSKSFLVPANEDEVLAFYQINLTAYGWSYEVREHTHLNSSTNEPLLNRCIRAERPFVVVYIDIISKQPTPDTLSHV